MKILLKSIVEESVKKEPVVNEVCNRFGEEEDHAEDHSQVKYSSKLGFIQFGLFMSLVEN